MKKTIVITTLLISFAAQAAEGSWTAAKPTNAPKSDIAIGQKGTAVAQTNEDWVDLGKTTKQPEKKPEASKSTGLISSPTMSGIAGSALDLTKNLLVGSSAKSDGGSKGSTWTGNVGFDIQNQGLDQTYVGPISTPVTNLGGGTTQIQFIGGGNTAAQQVNKKPKK